MDPSSCATTLAPNLLKCLHYPAVPLSLHVSGRKLRGSVWHTTMKGCQVGWSSGHKVDLLAQEQGRDVDLGLEHIH